MAKWIAAVILWCIAISLIIGMSLSGDTAVKTIDLSAVKAEQIVAGTNLLHPDFEVSLINFLGKSYNLVMVGVVDKSTVVFMGETGNQWYQAKGESLNLGVTQEVKEVKVAGQNLMLYCDKSGGKVVWGALICIIVFGVISLFVLL